MSKESEKVGTNLEKKVEYLEEEIRELKKRQDKIAKMVGENQPKEKLKIVKTDTNKDGELIKRHGCKAIRKLVEEVKKRKQLKTTQVQLFLDKQGFERSRPAVLRIMRRLASEWDYLKYKDSNTDLGNSHKLVYKG